ncbi:MAG: outer membrane beta-barrel protein [Bacteroidales bacterium]|nr:outer membrane beta-barrel protein [Bacteroidales bacterium]
MKKTSLMMVLSLTSFVASNAQLFVGGGFGFDAQSGSYEYDGNKSDTPSEVSFDFSPQVGFMLSDDFGVGAYLSFGLTRENDKGDPETIDKSSSVAFAPFARYYAFRFNKFSFYGEAQASLGFGSSKTEYDGDETDGPKTSEVGFYVFPGMAYDISNRFQLMARINAFGLGINHQISKNDETDVIVRSTDAGLHVSMNSIVTSGYITVGAIIKL